jgi:STE24 endopeptidase
MPFDAEAATRAWLATLDPVARARSDAYFEGGYWLLLWGALITAGLCWLALRSGLAARLSARIGRWTQRPWLRSLLFALLFLALLSVATLPWDAYTGFFREHQYGLSNQDLGQWFGDWTKNQIIGLVIMPLIFVAIHAVIRRNPRGWWGWATAIIGLFMFIGIALGPPLIEPLFNKYTPMAESPLQQQVLAMARANGVPADKVYVVDASRQTKRISANVAGILGTTRVALNDNLLKQTPDEVRAVLGHEIGHYALNHVWTLILNFTLLFGVMALLLARFLPWALARWGAGWGVTDIGDPAILPLLIGGATILGLLATPLTNSFTRVNEMEADRYGLNAARAPDAFASIAMKLSQYRKIEPSPLEEAIFFDHPSGKTRVETAMRWKAEHQGEPDVR